MKSPAVRVDGMLVNLQCKASILESQVYKGISTECD